MGVLLAGGKTVGSYLATAKFGVIHPGVLVGVGRSSDVVSRHRGWAGAIDLSDVTRYKRFMRPIFLLVWLLYLSACTTPSGASDQIPTIVPVKGPIGLYYDSQRPRWAGVTRVIDALTGAPLAEARVIGFAEPSYPDGKLPDHVTYNADRHGFVRIPARPRKPGWFLVEHDGYGTVAMMGYVPEFVHLMPGVDLPVEVVDPFGRPIPNARVGLCLGCGHTPDVRSAVTDARGIAVLPCTEPTTSMGEGSGIRDIYVLAPGFGGIYEDARWRLGDLPVTVRKSFVPAVEGRIRGANGKPVPGIAIGGSLHRGPWTWTDANGEFVHIGRESQHVPLRVVDSDREFYLQPSALGRSLDIVLPATELSARPLGRVRVEVRDPSGASPVSNARVKAWLPGFMHPEDPGGYAVTDDDGVCTIEVPEGSVELRVTDCDHVPAFDPRIVELEVTRGVEASATVHVAPRIYRKVTVDGDWDDGVDDDWLDVDLVTPYDTVSVGSMIRSGDPVPLPAAGPFALVVAPGGFERHFVFSDVPADPIEIRGFEPTRVGIRVSDVGGRPIEARVAVSYSAGDVYEVVDDPEPTVTESDGTATVLTSLVGCAFLHVEPLDDGLRSRVVHLSLPALGDGVLHEEEVVLPPVTMPQLRLLTEDGSPVGGHIRVKRPGLVVEAELSADGGYDGIELLPGDRLEWLPAMEWSSTTETGCAMTWSGQALWIPDRRATVHFDVVDEFGVQPNGLVAVVGDQVWHEYEECLVLEDMPVGPADIFVGADGCDSARVRIQLRAGSQRLQVKLGRVGDPNTRR
jgi:hypothetical protein